MTRYAVHKCLVCGYRGLNPPIVGSPLSCRDGHEVEVTPLVPASEVELLREALRDDRGKWGLTTLIYVGERLLAEVYPPDIFPSDDDEGDPGPRLVRAVRDCLASLSAKEPQP